MPARGYEPILTMKEKDIFYEPSASIRVIRTPGHTPYHMSFVISIKEKDKEKLYVHTGDLYITTTLPYPFHECSIPDMIRSLKKILRLDQSLIILPTHGKVPEKDSRDKLKMLLKWCERKK